MLPHERLAGIVLLAGGVLAFSAGAFAAEGANAAAGGAWADPAKTLRVMLPVAETGFDPAASGDFYSNMVIGAMFDSLYEWDYLARPWVRGYAKNAFRPQSWRFLDIDLRQRTAGR
jgi:ABC-type oligopeptide transport system substrate-binding subunit